jgi:hypothetical protein
MVYTKKNLYHFVKIIVFRMHGRDFIRGKIER